VWWAQRQSGTSVNLGIGDATAAAGLDVNQGTNLIFDVNTGVFSKYYSGASQSVPSSFTAPGASLIRFEYDAVNDNLYIYDDNVLAKTVTNTGIRANAVGPIFPIFGPYASTPATVLANFGGNGLPETPTSGYLPLNTSNLPAPAIPDGSAQFQTTLWTGTGGGRTLTQSGNSQFTPGFIWGKLRNDVSSHTLFDVLRGFGAAKALSSNVTDAEGLGGSAGASSLYGYVSAATSSGFTVANGTDPTYPDGYWNWTGKTFAAWQWKANGAGVSNTSGTITSTVSANTTAGFSVVKYTGTGSAASIGHGLGATPKLIIAKKYNTTNDWCVYTSTTGTGNSLFLNLTNGSTSSAQSWTAVGSTTFSVGTGGDVNTNGATYIAYCFAEIPGYSKIGSYTGNGSADGPFVYTGFRPAYVMAKRTDSTADWFVTDTARSTYNPTTGFSLYPNLTNSEGSDMTFDLLSNGFKVRQTSAWLNASGGTYIFYAVAERPFGGVGVSPATAR
jgi:hypothetical protein